jgi:hypothetical protein
MLFDETNWLAYRETNMLFAEAVRNEVKSGDMVWVQDYHLMLLPMMLRSLVESSKEQGKSTQQEMRSICNGLQMSEERSYYLDNGGKTTDGNSKRGNIRIGFFLHTPFPSSEIYRILPVRKEILLGVLHCDLIGFHTYDYARHFLSSCARILGLSTMPNGECDFLLSHSFFFPYLSLLALPLSTFSFPHIVVFFSLPLSLSPYLSLSLSSYLSLSPLTSLFLSLALPICPTLSTFCPVHHSPFLPYLSLPLLSTFSLSRTKKQLSLFIALPCPRRIPSLKCSFPLSLLFFIFFTAGTSG